jgi:hypothetical protein
VLLLLFVFVFIVTPLRLALGCPNPPITPNPNNNPKINAKRPKHPNKPQQAGLQKPDGFTFSS